MVCCFHGRISLPVPIPLAEFSLVKWLRKNAIDRFISTKSLDAGKPRVEAWKDREASEDTLKTYLADFPGAPHAIPRTSFKN